MQDLSLRWVCLLRASRSSSLHSLDVSWHTGGLTRQTIRKKIVQSSGGQSHLVASASFAWTLWKVDVADPPLRFFSLGCLRELDIECQMTLIGVTGHPTAI